MTDEWKGQCREKKVSLKTLEIRASDGINKYEQKRREKKKTHRRLKSEEPNIRVRTDAILRYP